MPWTTNDTSRTTRLLPTGLVKEVDASDYTDRGPCVPVTERYAVTSIVLPCLGYSGLIFHDTE